MPGEYPAGAGQSGSGANWELLDNQSGNSSSQDRKAILDKCIRLLGKERIGLLIAEREFVGHAWLKYLKDNGIAFCVRLPKHHLIERQDGRVLQPTELTQEQAWHLKDCLVDGIWGQVYLRQLTNGDLLYLFGTLDKFTGVGGRLKLVFRVLRAAALTWKAPI